MKNNTPTTFGNVPQSFLSRHGQEVIGSLSGFDRLRFMGSLRTLQRPHGMLGYLHSAGVLLKHFSDHVRHLTARLRQATDSLAKAAGVPVEYLPGNQERKNELAQKAAAQRGITEGLVGVWNAVEPCRTYFVRGNRQQQRLELKYESGKCLHSYFYFADADFGLMHLRLQTWFPFGVTVCLNGRLWLARQMERAGIGFCQQGNCFTWIEDFQAAQRLADEQLSVPWADKLDALLLRCHPLAQEICAPIGARYYWSVQESEYATDLLYPNPAALAQIYPRLLHHGISHFQSGDVMRFLGHKTPASGQVNARFEGELCSNLKRRPEGLRIKHSVAGNSVKMYDKEGQVLRVETTLNHPGKLKVFRTSEARPEEPKAWRPLRKSVADTHRRAQVSHKANLRYLEGLAACGNQQPAGEAAQSIFAPLTHQGRRYRALNPWLDKDARLLEAIADGRWVLSGLRNRDLREALFGPDATKPKAQVRKDAAKTSRLLALLRAHRIVQKVAGTHRYQVTPQGRQIITAIQAARKASVEALNQLAA